MKNILNLIQINFDLFIVFTLILSLEFIILIYSITSTRQTKQNTTCIGISRKYSIIYIITIYTVLVAAIITIIFVKHEVLVSSYTLSKNFIGLEPLLTLATIISALLAFLGSLIKSDIKVKLVIFFIILFSVSYVTIQDPFSQKIFTDRIIAATFVAKKGMYSSGLLDKAYDPIPFDVTIYSVLAIIFGVEPSSIFIVLVYPITILAVMYVVTWYLLVFSTGRNNLNKNGTLKVAFTTISLSHISSWISLITAHEALWTGWLLAMLAIYIYLRTIRKTKSSSIIIIQLLILSAIFYHITTIIILLALIIFVLINLIFLRTRTLKLSIALHLMMYVFILSYIKSSIISGYVLKDFLLLLKGIVRLEYSEELSIYVRTSILSNPNNYLRFAQISPSLILAMAFSSITFYIIKILKSKTFENKYKDLVENTFGLSLLSTGFFILVLSLLSTLIPRTTFNTTFLRPAVILLLLGSLPYTIEKFRTIYKNKNLVLIQLIVLVLIVGIGINDISVTPRKGLESPFIYVHYLDMNSLQYLERVSTDSTVIGFPESSLYSNYLNLIYSYKINTFGSTKKIRAIYENIHEVHRVPKDLHNTLLVTMNNSDMKSVIGILNIYLSKIYDSKIYFINIAL